MSTLESQIAALKSRRRSTSEFYEWKPGIFYYPYVPLGAFVVYFLVAPPWFGMRTLVTTGLSFGLLCYLPLIASRLRLWVFFRWPNRILERKIASLQAQLDRRIASGGRDA